MAVVASATGAAVFGLSGVAAGLAGGALLGAGIGGLYSAVTGDGDILNSMLTGGLIGGAAGGLGAGYAASTAAAEAAAAAGATGAGTIGPAATTVATPTAALTSSNTAGLNALAANAGVVPELASSLPGAGLMAAPEVVTPAMIEAGKAGALKTAAGLTGKEMLGYGLAGTGAMQLLGGKGKGANAPASATDPGNIRPYTFSPNQMAAGDFPSPYATAQYDAAGMPIMDTRERNYFDQKYTALTPYSARAGTVNPNVPVAAARGGLMAIGGPVERMSQNVMGGQGNMFPLSQQEHTNFATPTQMPASAEVIRSDYDAKTQPYTGVMMANGGMAKFADKGMVDEEAELRKTVMNNLKKLNPEQMQNVMGSFQQEDMREKQFLMKNMPNYASSMAPSISSMVEGAQYGDRMAQSFGGQPRDINVMPRIQDADNYGGIASIGRQIDPDTRVNMMADLQRTPYDRNALESVRRVGAGIDRKIGKDANLSAYYEQDPMGRSKAGGLRYTQNFGIGGDVGGAYDLGGYSDGGRLLKGPGDGVSDDIPATIAGKQPARLADGEFVIPARIVSEIGNGSTDAGAKRLYAMMDKIQAGRKKTIGKKNIAKDTKAKKHLLA
jgi:hypothetical protein